MSDINLTAVFTAYPDLSEMYWTTGAESNFKLVCAAVEAREEAIVRASNLNFTYERPDFVRKSRTSCAYDTGYEAGFRKWEYRNPYSTTHHTKAYDEGFRKGQMAASAAIFTALQKYIKKGKSQMSKVTTTDTPPLTDEQIVNWCNEHLGAIEVAHDIQRGNNFLIEFCYESTGCAGEVKHRGSFREAIALAYDEQKK